MNDDELITMKPAAPLIFEHLEEMTQEELDGLNELIKLIILINKS